MSWKIKKRIKTHWVFFSGFPDPFFQTFTGLRSKRLLFDLVRFSFLLGFSFNFYYRAIMVGESFKGASYEDEMFN